MKPLQAVLGLILILLPAVGCSALAPEPTAMPTATLTIAPTQTEVPTATVTLTPEPTEFVFTPISAKLTVSDVNMRANPGTLFAVKQLLSQSTDIQIIGQSQGGEWYFVETNAGNQGWIFSQLLTPAEDPSAAPVVETDNTQLVTGTVTDAAGQPVSGIQFSIVQDTATTTALTDETGVFYAYLPAKSTGMWAVVYTAVSCSSNSMDSNCNCLGGTCKTVQPTAANVVLPQTETVKFEWK